MYLHIGTTSRHLRNVLHDELCTHSLPSTTLSTVNKQTKTKQNKTCYTAQLHIVTIPVEVEVVYMQLLFDKGNYPC